MAGNPYHDDEGRFTTGPSSGRTGGARAAIDWVKSGEAKAAVAKLASPDNVKAAATFAVQGALFKLGGINEPNVDAAIRASIDSLASDLRVTRTHARQVMIAVVRSMRKAREGGDK